MVELRKAYHDDLEQARFELARLAALVVELLPRATAVLLNGDLDGAEVIINGDAEFDHRCVELEEHCLRILALQSPVATELRQVVALMKMVAEVERSGDLICNICKAARRIYPRELDPTLRGVITQMSEHAQKLYSGTIEAFLQNDDTLAAAIDDMDAFLDALQKQLIQVIFESHSGGSIDLQGAVQLAAVARFYERIGDHAVNIAERVRFVKTGWMPDHKKAPRPKIHLGDSTTSAPGES